MGLFWIFANFIFHRIAFPLIIFIKLKTLKAKKLLKLPESLYTYGFFYLAYKKHYYFYDIIVILRKILIFILAGIFSDEI